MKSVLRLLLTGLFAAQAASAQFPFTISGNQFLKQGTPVFLHMIGYQPLEPGQGIDDDIRPARISEDMQRLRAFRGGTEPLLLRVYAQPTTMYPVRMPKAFYDGVRNLGFWVVRDIYFAGYSGATAITDGQAKVDAVINEVATCNAFDRIFAWEIGNEFQAFDNQQATDLRTFIDAMRNHIRNRMSEPGREGFSNWVTWGSWPVNDPLRTTASTINTSQNGVPVLVPSLDFISYNAYSYDPERIRDHQAGPVTGRPFEGYLAALKAAYPSKPLMISETGLPDSGSAVGLDQARIPPISPAYRRGALSHEQVVEGVEERFWDARLSGLVAGVGVFEWNDEWHKAGNPATHDADPEESFGMTRFGGTPLGARSKLVYETVRRLFTLSLPAPGFSVSISPASTQLTSTGQVAVTAQPAGSFSAPLTFRWECSRGKICGQGAAAVFRAADGAFGPAKLTVVAIDGLGRATSGSATVEILPTGGPEIQIVTQGTARASGLVRNADLSLYKVVVYVETDRPYVQPFGDMKSIWVRPDGHWWTRAFAVESATLRAWLVPVSYDPPSALTAGSAPPGMIASASFSGINDADNDMLPDSLESNSTEDRYSDPDGDGADNLTELLAGTNWSSPDNDTDLDGLADSWELHYFGSLAYGGSDDPDGDGLSNAVERSQLTNPTRPASDADCDGLPDAWELRIMHTLAQDAADDWNHDGVSNLDAFELGIDEDFDLDGMPDTWESANSFNSDLASDGPLDSDGDGFSNLEEYLSGTDPNLRTSHLLISNASRIGADVIVAFQTVPFKLYTVEVSEELTPGSWFSLLTDYVGTGSAASAYDYGAATKGRRFYRLSVR